MKRDPTGGARGIAVEDTGGPLKAPVGKAILSRMFDVFGNAIDRQAAPTDLQWRTVHRAPPPLARRSTKSEVFETGNVAATNHAGLEKNPNGPEKDAFGITGGGLVRYDLDASGNISNGRLIYRDDTIFGDSMAMDMDGNLYATFHNSNPKDPKGYIVVIDPEGRVIERITTPERSLPTNLGFGRGTDENSLYLTNLGEWRLWRIQTVRRGLYRD